MKTFILIMLTLFSFQHNERYVAQSYTCENNIIQVEYDKNTYTLSLFNVLLHEDSDVCSYVEGELSFSFDPYVKIESPYPAYIFIDNQLLQQTLIDDEQADIKIRQPNYQYQLSEKESVMKEVEKEEVTSTISRSRKIAYGLFAIWGLLVVLVLCLRIKAKRKG